jgi:hypothetical protein
MCLLFPLILSFFKSLKSNLRIIITFSIVYICKMSLNCFVWIFLWTIKSSSRFINSFSYLKAKTKTKVVAVLIEFKIWIIILWNFSNRGSAIITQRLKYFSNILNWKSEYQPKTEELKKDIQNKKHNLKVSTRYWTTVFISLVCYY